MDESQVVQTAAKLTTNTMTLPTVSMPQSGKMLSYHFLHSAVFKGFAGSSGPSQETKKGSGFSPRAVESGAGGSPLSTSGTACCSPVAPDDVRVESLIAEIDSEDLRISCFSA